MEYHADIRWVPFRHARYRDLGGELGGARFSRFHVIPYESMDMSMSGFESRMFLLVCMCVFQRQVTARQEMTLLMMKTLRS